MTPATHTPSLPGTLAIDAQGLESLRLKARTHPGESVAAVSKQFESLFLGMVLKGMRSAAPQDGPFDNEQTRLYTSLLDQQLAQHMAKRGTGLAEVMARQLSPNFADSSKPGNLFPDLPAAFVPAAPAPSTAPAAPRAATPASGASSGQQPGDFVNRVWSHAVDAAQAIGVQPQFIVGQAALESGWGKHEIRTADGQPSHNLFGIKAAGNWKGPSVEKSTIEYVNGVAVKTTDKFRVYASYGESFRDYVNLLRDNARYSGVVGQADAKGFAQGLQRGGYATDPAYADKLVSVINSTRDLALSKTLPDMPAGVAVAQSGASVTVAAAAPPSPAYTGGLMRAAYNAIDESGTGVRGDFPANIPAALAARPAPAPAVFQPSVAAPSAMPAAPRAATPASGASSGQQPGDFVNRVWSHAVDAAQAIGVQPQFIVGQAALESGWGKHEIRTADGQPSHNLFGIRAGADWKGPIVEKTATVFANGVATRVTEKFRVYASYSESFRDYASFLRDNTRYAGVMGQGDAKGFARGLQRAGYATDPVYADKLVSVINSPPLRQAVADERRPQLLAQR